MPSMRRVNFDWTRFTRTITSGFTPDAGRTTDENVRLRDSRILSWSVEPNSMIWMCPQLSVYSAFDASSEGESSTAAVCGSRGPKSGTSCFVQLRNSAANNAQRQRFAPKELRLRMSGLEDQRVCMK